MRLSTIKTILRNHCNNWIDSVLDKQVQDLAKRNTIITGGAITSMLLNEKVNDFDVYFRDIETATAVAEYYVNLYNGTTKKLRGVKGIPEVQLKTITNIKNEDETRVTIFIKSSGVVGEMKVEQTPELISEVAAVKEKFRPIFFSNNAISLTSKTQLVIRFFGEPSEIHKNYDFVHATSVYDYRYDQLDIPKEVYESIITKRLIYNGSLYPVASLFRLRKFIKRGWSVSAGQILKIAHQISAIDLTDIEVLREQLIGVDQSHMQTLIGVLESRDPKQRIDNIYITTLLDEIIED